MGLHDGCMVVEVDDKSGEIVALAMYEAACVVLLSVDETEGLTEVACHTEATYPELVIDFFFLECEYTDGYAAYLIVSGCYVLLVGSIDFDYLSFFGIAFHTGYGSGEHPWVETEEGFFFLGFEIYFVHY